MNFIEALSGLTKEKNIKFTFGGKPITYEDVFSETGLLPAIAHRADRLCSLCLGYGIGASFTEVERSVLGTRVQFDDVTPNALRLLFIYDVVMEIVNGSSAQDQVALDELMYD